MPTLDVLIPIYNRPAALAVTLTSLCAQTRRAPGDVPFRVVVSDQSDVPIESFAEVRAVLAVLRANGHDVEVLRHLPRRGLAELPREHCGEDVLAQLRVMARFGGCGVLPSGVYHLELPTTVPNREVDDPRVLPSSIAQDAAWTHRG